MPRGVPRKARRNGKVNGVKVYGTTLLVMTMEKSAGKPKVVDLGDRWAVVASQK